MFGVEYLLELETPLYKKKKQVIAGQ